MKSDSIRIGIFKYLLDKTWAYLKSYHNNSRDSVLQLAVGRGTNLVVCSVEDVNHLFSLLLVFFIRNLQCLLCYLKSK